MTDLGTTDTTNVCGPKCKAAKPEASWWSTSTLSEKVMTAFYWTVIIACAVLGALDIGLRVALHYWHF